MRWFVLASSGQIRRFLVDQSGQAIVWVAVMLPLFLSVIGLAIDGGLVFSARRDLQNVADSAARAGAMQIDERVYRESFGERVVLDVAAAQDAAASYVVSQYSDMRATVDAETQGVFVQVRRDVPTTFLRLVGVQSAHVTATASAVPRYGIERGNR